MAAPKHENDKAGNKHPAPWRELPRLFLSRRWWWVTLLVIGGMVLTIRLGIWQLDRLQQRRTRNAEYLHQISAAPLDLNRDSLPVDSAELQDRLAHAIGRFDYAEQIILLEQSYQGRPGVHLVTPFLVDNRELAVLVDRGWIPAHEYEAGDLSRFQDGEQVAVTGSIQKTQALSGGRETNVEGEPLEWYRIDIEAIQDQVPYELLPFYLLERPPSEIQEQLPYRVQTEIDLSDGPHLGYAIQWFSFCVILAAGYVYFVRNRSGR